VSDWVVGLKEEVVALCTAVERVSGLSVSGLSVSGWCEERIWQPGAGRLAIMVWCQHMRIPPPSSHKAVVHMLVFSHDTHVSRLHWTESDRLVASLGQVQLASAGQLTMTKHWSVSHLHAVRHSFGQQQTSQTAVASDLGSSSSSSSGSITQSQQADMQTEERII
jgi:hypothetical protein